EGVCDITVETDVWDELGVTGYVEQLNVQCEIEQLPTLDYPSVEFVQTGGAVAPEDSTLGQFAFAVQFETHGGAQINPNSLECYIDRDIEVNGQLVEAWTNVAQLWNSVNESSGDWLIEQVFTDEVIDPGILTCAVSIANTYGYRSQQSYIRIYVEG